MAKRSTFDRQDRDLYPTPQKAMWALLNHLPSGQRFAEPCAGPGWLGLFLELHGHECTLACDIEPICRGVDARDALSLTRSDFQDVDVIITNTPWKWEFLKAFLDRLLTWRIPCWLLLDAGFAHNIRSSTYMDYCERWVSVGRLKWFPDSEHTSKDNSAWFLFLPHPVTSTSFFGRSS